MLVYCITSYMIIFLFRNYMQLLKFSKIILYKIIKPNINKILISSILLLCIYRIVKLLYRSIFGIFSSDLKKFYFIILIISLPVIIEQFYISAYLIIYYIILE